MIKFFKNNILFTVSLTLALLSSLVVGSFDLALVDWEIIITLFGMMLVLGVFKSSGVLREIAHLMIERSNSTRRLVRNMMILSFVISFILTNDVAVLTVMPLYLTIVQNIKPFKGSLLGAVLLVVAANMGGVFFPFSNPQNLIIYNTYAIDNLTFISWTTPLLVAGLLILLIFCQRIEDTASEGSIKSRQTNKKYVILGVIGLITMILSVFSVLNVFYVVAIISLIFVFVDIDFFRQADYPLLGVFASFFIIVGNISSFAAVSEFLTNWLTTPIVVYFTGLSLSQFISNVPTTILLTPFTSQAHAILLGTNIGGLGSLLASIANLIGYNIFRRSCDDKTSKTYLKLFTKVNLIFIALLTILAIIILWNE